MEPAWDPRQQWLDGVEQADFPVYGAVADGGVWTIGGIGHGPDRIEHLAVDTIVGETSISVDSIRLPSDGDPDLRRQMMALGIIHQPLLRTGSMVLPFTITIVSDDRTIPVDGIDRQFVGMRVEGEPGWAGECELDDVILRVETTFDGPFVIDRIAEPAAIPETPPE